MGKKTLIIFLVVVFLSIGCVSVVHNPSQAVSSTLPLISHPIIPGWKFVDSPQLSRNGYTLNVLEVWFWHGTQVFYVLTGSWSDQLVEREIIQIRDNLGNVRELFEMVPVFRTEEIELGVMRFNNRDGRSRELYLQMLAKPEQDNLIETLMLKALEGDPEYIKINCGGCSFGIENPQISGDNQISMGCDLFHPKEFQLHPELLTPGAHDTQIPVEPSMLATATPYPTPSFHGVQFTFEIKNKTANSAHCYTMQFHDDGTVSGFVDEAESPLVSPPILFPAHVPSEPYPGPQLSTSTIPAPTLTPIESYPIP